MQKIIVILSVLALTGCGGAGVNATAPNTLDNPSGQYKTTTVSEEEIIEPSVEYIRTTMDRSIFLDPPETEFPKVYVRVRNTSDADIDLQSHVKNHLRDNGYVISPSAKNVDYILQANILWAREATEAELNNIDESEYGTDVSKIVSAGVAGAGLGYAVDYNTGNRSAAGIGTAAGLLIGIAVAASQEKERIEKLERMKATKRFVILADIEVRHRVNGQVVRKGQTSIVGKAPNSVHGDKPTLSSVSLEVEGKDWQGEYKGNLSFNSTNEGVVNQESETYTETSDWARKQVRMSSYAKGVHITFDDVKEDLTKKLSSNIANMF